MNLKYTTWQPPTQQKIIENKLPKITFSRLVYGLNQELDARGGAKVGKPKIYFPANSKIVGQQKGLDEFTAARKVIVVGREGKWGG